MKYICGILFLISFNASAQVNTGARFTAMASAGVSIRDVWSMQQNQAGIASINKATVALAVEKPFAGFELSTQSAIVILPFNKHVFGISIQRYGFTSYSEQRAAFTYARSFGERLNAALNFNYHLLKIPAYGSSQTYSVEAGIQYQLNEKIGLAAHLANPGKRRFDNDMNAGIPFRLQAGGSYIFSEKVLLAASIEKTVGFSFDNRFGLEYQFLELLALRGGISTSPFKHYAGFGVNYRKLKIDIATSSQPVLGYSPQIALSYEF